MANFYKIENNCGASVTLCDLGATVISIKVPDKNGDLRDVVLGYNSIEGYEKGGMFFGATVGRCCGRISGGSFRLNDEMYHLSLNHGSNHLHGGFKNFSQKIWNTSVGKNKLAFSLQSPDKDEGYPGNMEVTVRYEFDENCVLKIEYHAVCDKDTVCNLTNHAYFNLNGHENGDIKGHFLKINAEQFIEVDRNLIPTGRLLSVRDTPFDFSERMKIGEGLKSKDKQLKYGGGYDHAFILRENGGSLQTAAIAEGEESGIMLECRTTSPVLHFYTANGLYVKPDFGKDGAAYKSNSGFCFETQGYPDAVNHENFPTTILKAGMAYHQVTEFAFSHNI